MVVAVCLVVVVVRLAVEVVVVEKKAMNSFEAKVSWRAGELATSRREPSISFRAKLNTNAWSGLDVKVVTPKNRIHISMYVYVHVLSPECTAN